MYSGRCLFEADSVYQNAGELITQHSLMVHEGGDGTMPISLFVLHSMRPRLATTMSFPSPEHQGQSDAEARSECMGVSPPPSMSWPAQPSQGLPRGTRHPVLYGIVARQEKRRSV